MSLEYPRIIAGAFINFWTHDGGGDYSRAATIRGYTGFYNLVQLWYTNGKLFGEVES